MILNKEKYISIGLCPRNYKYYENLGYKIPRKIDKRGRTNFTKGSKIKVKVKDLMPSSKVKVLCKCEECGKERYIENDSIRYRKNSQYLKTGKTLCVVCSNKKLFTGKNNPNYIHGCNRYCEYRNNAKRRNIEFNLTSEEFKSFICKPCHYCGGFSIEKNKKSRGNGIDRKDSNQGYKVDNCVPCCATCNFVKNNMPYNEFIEYIKRIYNKIKNNEI